MCKLTWGNLNLLQWCFHGWWAGSDLGCATKAIFTSVSIRNSTLSIKSLQKRMLSLSIQFCFCGWPVLLSQFMLLATVQLERTRGWLESPYEVTLHGLSYAQKDIPGRYVRILTTFFWKPCAERSACACTDQCSGTQEAHWGTWQRPWQGCASSLHTHTAQLRGADSWGIPGRNTWLCCSCWHPM